MFTIDQLVAWEILDSRGRPTLAARATLRGGGVGVTQVPSGASTGEHEAVERRDGDPSRYRGLGVTGACQAIETDIAKAVAGRTLADLAELDRAMVELDGTPNKARLGANALLAVSQAVTCALADQAGQPLHQYLSEHIGVPARLPVPHFNMINGGAHAANRLRFQEFMVAPTGAPSISEAIRCGAEVYAALKDLVVERFKSAGVSDEGGFAPDIATPEQALDLLVGAIQRAGYQPRGEVELALDPAANGFLSGDAYHPGDGTLDTSELIDRYERLISAYPIRSIEDGLAETDRRGWRMLTAAVGEWVQVVGDDLLVTDPHRIRDAARDQLANAALIKPNQIGTVTETLAALAAAREAGWGAMISHRSGETTDTFIADLAVAAGVGQLKTGAPARGERVAKYNRLLEIEGTSGRGCPTGWHTDRRNDSDGARCDRLPADGSCPAGAVAGPGGGDAGRCPSRQHGQPGTGAGAGQAGRGGRALGRDRGRRPGRRDSRSPPGPAAGGRGGRRVQARQVQPAQCPGWPGGTTGRRAPPHLGSNGVGAGWRGPGGRVRRRPPGAAPTRPAGPLRHRGGQPGQPPGRGPGDRPAAHPAAGCRGVPGRHPRRRVGARAQHPLHRRLPDLDAAVLVTSADPPISGAERAFLQRVTEHAVRLFVVLNKADYLTAGDLERTVAFTEQVVREVLPDWPGPVYPLSARPGVGDPKGVRRFADDLARFLRQERVAVVTDSARRSAARGLASLRLVLELERRAASLPSEELAARRAQFAAVVDRLAGDTADDAALLGAAVRRGLEALDERLAPHRAELAGQAERATVEAAERHPDAGPGRLLELLAAERPALLEELSRELVEQAGAVAVTAYRQAAAGVADRAADRVQRLQAGAASAFGVPLPDFAAPDVDLGIVRVSFTTPRVGLLAEQLASASWRLLGARAARARAIARAHGQAAEEAEMLLGRLRGATSQQLGEAARQLGARLQRHQAALAASLSAAIDRGGGLLAEAEDRRDQRTAELDRAAELLASVTAWIQPTAVPSPASQAATADRVQ